MARADFTETKSVMAPASNAAAVTPSDVTDFTNSDDTVECRMIHIQTGGNLVVDMEGTGSDVTIVVTDDTYVPIIAEKIKAATTATGITRFW